MKKLALLVATVSLIVSMNAFAGVKTYQVTGPVLEVTAGSIVVQKGADKWEIARDAGTKVTGDLKVGSKVTIQYTMTATTVDVKADAAKKAADKPAKAEKADTKAKK